MSDTLPPVPPGSTIRKNADGSWSCQDGPYAWRSMTTPKPLSPAAQAMKSAAKEPFWDWANMQPRDPQEIAAFLIRRLVILQGQPTPGGSVILSGDDLLAIATELEGHHG